MSAAAVGLVVSVAAARRLARRGDARSSDARSGGGQRGDRWHTVTVNREPEEVGQLPPPLDTIGFAVEVSVRPAPGGRGTELAARIADADAVDRDHVRALRTALREARALAETGEVPLPDSPSTTKTTPLNAPLAYVTRHGREEGRL